MKQKANKWDLQSLPELKTGDNLAFKAVGLQIPQVKIIGAESYHWGLVGERVFDNYVSVGDYSVFDSTTKGVTAHLLSEYQTRHMKIYRPKLEPGVLDSLKRDILKRCYYYGTDRYDWRGLFMVALWCLIRKVKPNVEWWEHNSNKLWCLEFNEVILRPLIPTPLVPASEPPYPTNMENSPHLELIWSSY